MLKEFSECAMKGNVVELAGCLGIDATVGGSVKSMGAARTTFVIGKDGKMSHVFENVNPEGHDRVVMDWLKNNAA